MAFVAIAINMVTIVAGIAVYATHLDASMYCDWYAQKDVAAYAAHLDAQYTQNASRAS